MTSLYDISIPVITNVLNTLTSILQKGAQHAKENNISEAELLSSRIYEDMYPLSIQVLIVCMTAKKAVERLTGITISTMPKIDGEVKSLEELYAIVEGTLQELAAVDRASVEGKDNDEIVFNIGRHIVKKATLSASVLGHSLPFAFFHLDIAYAILRQNGVPLGKLDYISEFAKGMPDA